MTKNQWENWDENLFNDGTGDGRKKQKKDPYDNPPGFTQQPDGIIRDTEDIIRQGKETDRATGQWAQQSGKPVQTPDINPDTDKSSISGNRFGYDSKTYDTRPVKKDKRDVDYENNLRTGSANEGYILPPVQPSRGNTESYPGEKQTLHDTAANEGFTIKDSDSYRKAKEKSDQNIKNLTAFLGRFLQGNERENRFANGIPAPGETHQSVAGTYIGAKNKSDNTTQDDWNKTVQNLKGSSVGQGTMDVYHGGARGMYELGNEGLTVLGNMAQKKELPLFPYPGTHYAILERILQGTHPDKKIDGRYDMYQLKKTLRDKAEEHLQAQSQDYRQSGWTSNQGYLGVKGAGEFARDLPAILTAGSIVNSLGAGWGALYSALEGGVSELTDHYDKEIDKYMVMPQEEIEKYPEYIQAKKEGRSEEHARFRAADPRAKEGALISLFTGVVKGMMKEGVNRMTGSLSDSILTRITQNFLGGKAVDGVFEQGRETFEK